MGTGRAAILEGGHLGGRPSWRVAILEGGHFGGRPFWRAAILEGGHLGRRNELVDEPLSGPADLDGVLLLVRLLVKILAQEIPGGFGALGGVELPAPQRERAEGEAEGQAAQRVVDGEVILLQVPVVVEVQDGEIIAADGVELHVCGAGGGEVIGGGNWGL